MPFIPHTNEDVTAMLSVLGVADTQALFDEIPANLCVNTLPGVPDGLTEMQLANHFRELAARDERALCFIGAGAYEHHIPAAVWDIASRGEFMTAYTPYQAEASQGTLQLLYEFQTMMASLTGMDVSNASCYDGGSALAEAVLMAIRSNKKATEKIILMPETVHPAYRDAVRALVSRQGITCESLPLCEKTGTTSPDAWKKLNGRSVAAVVIPFPTFFGSFEDVDAITRDAHAHGALVIAVCNPLSLALFKAPGSWGDTGADIVCGEAQPFGMPLASGGPYAGYLCCKEAFVRQMPGRIVGRTTDATGRPGFTLTLQAREQHIRRAKATSNICTNQGLLVTVATLYLSLLGPVGLRQVAMSSHANTRALIDAVKTVPGVMPRFNSPVFHEVLLRLPIAASRVIDAMASAGIDAGFDVSAAYPSLTNTLLVCVTETKSMADIAQYVSVLRHVLAKEAVSC